MTTHPPIHLLDGGMRNCATNSTICRNSPGKDETTDHLPDHHGQANELHR